MAITLFLRLRRSSSRFLCSRAGGPFTVVDTRRTTRANLDLHTTSHSFIRILTNADAPAAAVVATSQRALRPWRRATSGRTVQSASPLCSCCCRYCCCLTARSVVRCCTDGRRMPLPPAPRRSHSPCRCASTRTERPASSRHQQAKRQRPLVSHRGISQRSRFRVARGC